MLPLHIFDIINKFVKELENTENKMLNLKYFTLISSTGVFSGISLRMTVQRVWLGRTFFPSTSTCTFWDSKQTKYSKWIRDE